MAFSKRYWDRTWKDLHEWVKKQPDMPVRELWDLQSMTFSYVMKARWDTRVARPFYKNAPPIMKYRAQDLAKKMNGDAELVRTIFNETRDYMEDDP